MKPSVKPFVKLTGLPMYWLLVPLCLVLLVACSATPTVPPTSTSAPTPTPVPGVRFKVGDRVELRLPPPKYGGPASPDGVKTIKAIIRHNERLIIAFEDGTSMANGGSEQISEEELQSYLTLVP